MIISASYRTDIPAFYGKWFMKRLDAGFCSVVNPYGGAATRVPLDPASVTGFVFWTKNLRPFLKHLPEIRRRGYPFIVTYTITDYPRALEPFVADVARSADALWRAADQFGPRTCAWRYDPVVFTSLTPPDFHLRSFEHLARELEGATDEAVISFAQVYRKTRRNMNRAAREGGFAWTDPPDEEKRALARRFVEIAGAHGMKLSICAQRRLLVEGAHDARCVDAGRLAAVGADISRVREKPHRDDCGCFESRDIGQYDTCPHGCVYCYAVRSRTLARARFKAHDPAAEFLVPPPKSVASKADTPGPQLRLFG